MSDRLCPWCKIGHFQRTPWLYTYQCDECGTATVIEEERRICCIVPFCRRTRGDRKGSLLTPGMEWICRAHWTPIRLERRKVYRRALNAFKDNPTDKNRDIAFGLWGAMKREAIERAAGI
ncbi:hypothetical protein [Rhizobium sp. 11515TR]|uniref:hypothetical protein n=1 Tax=Rhizobium sp. 11515TR TaxID=2028343 RepID=UPI000BA8800C|nr:hypothetical protein [Rhizobium sp. 11515TR]ASW06285.1 hypothetical protein CKA34_10585 [Rhizobium sp. 11515TR]